MQLRHLCILTSVSLGAMLVQAGLAPTFAQSAAALTGTVSSAEEGNMEGVLVTAKKEGSTVALTVVTDDKGNYAFPADKLSPGKYKITMRAVGYVLPATEATVTAGQTAKADLKLGKTRNIVGQLSNAEFLISAPGTDRQKEFLTQCVGCHTLQRVFTSQHTPEEF